MAMAVENSKFKNQIRMKINNIYIILFIILSLYKGFSQNDSLIDNIEKMKKFNFEDYNEFVRDRSFNQSDKTIDGFYKKGKERIRIVTDKSHISLSKEWDDNQYKEIYHYSINTYQLVLYAKYFSHVPCGVRTKYDEEGNLIEKIDHDNDEHFNFSIEELIEKMQKEYKIDINDKYLVSIERYYKKDFDTSFYSLIVRPFIDSNRHDGYIVDGNTGRTLMIKHIERGVDLNIRAAFLCTLTRK